MGRSYNIAASAFKPPFRIEGALGSYRTYAKAKKAARALAEANLNQSFFIYDSKHDNPIHESRMFFRWDDPVWNAIPSTEDCYALLTGVLEMAHKDSRINPKTGREALERDTAISFLRGWV